MNNRQILLDELSKLVVKTSTPPRDEDGKLNIFNASNLINLDKFNAIIQRLLEAGAKDQLAQVINTRDDLILAIQSHQLSNVRGIPTASSRLAQQNKPHWSDDQMKQWIAIVNLQVQQLQQQRRAAPAGFIAHHHHHHNKQQQQQRRTPTAGYPNHNEITVKVAHQKTHQVGDIFFDTEEGGGYLYPISVGKYYEPVDPITFVEMNELVKEVKDILKKEMLLQSNLQQLTPNMSNAIDEISMQNVVGFLLQKSIADTIDVIPGMAEPWLYLKSIVSFKNYGHYALVWLPTPTDFISNHWQSTKSKLPSIIPDSPTIQAIVTRFKKAKHRGFAFAGELDTHYFLLSQAYRRFFESTEWDFKERNTCFGKWDPAKSKLIQQKEGKKGEYTFLQLPKV